MKKRIGVNKYETWLSRKIRRRKKSKKIKKKLLFIFNFIKNIEGLKHLFEILKMESQFYSNETLSEAFTPNKNIKIFSCYDNSRLVGIIRACGDSLYSTNIDMLVVHPAYQGIGIGTELIDLVKDEYKNCKYINVCPDEKAVDFYIKNGFRNVNGYYQLHL